MSLRPLAPLFLALVAACATPSGSAPAEAGAGPYRFGGGPSVLPNLGVTASAAVLLRERESHDLWGELQVTQQCLDDTDLTGGRRDAAGDWTQLQVGVKYELPLDQRRDWTVRTGLVWFEARGEPNIVNDAGDYYGAYLGVGFETAFSEHFSAGPQLAGLFTFEEGGSGFDLVPQLTWHFLWRY